jgi:hypothetical protein
MDLIVVELLAYVGLMLDSIAIRVIESNVERRLDASIQIDVEKSLRTNYLKMILVVRIPVIDISDEVGLVKGV